MGIGLKILSLLVLTIIFGCVSNSPTLKKPIYIDSFGDLRKVHGIANIFCNSTDSNYKVVFKERSYSSLNPQEKETLEEKCLLSGVTVIADDKHSNPTPGERVSFCSIWANEIQGKIESVELYFPISWHYSSGPSYKYSIRYEGDIPYIDSLISSSWVD